MAILNSNDLNIDESAFLKYFVTFMQMKEFDPTVDELTSYGEYAKLSSISTIEDGAIYCSMLHDSIIDYMVTMRSGVSTESGRKYLTSDYLLSIFPRFDASVHRTILETEYSSLIKFYFNQLNLHHQTNEPIITSDLIMKVMLLCIRIVKILSYIGNNHLVFRNSPFGSINFRALNYEYFSNLTETLIIKSVINNL